MAYSEDDLTAYKLEMSYLEEEISNLQLLVKQRQLHQVSSVSWSTLTSAKKRRKTSDIDSSFDQTIGSLISDAENELLLLKYFTGIELKTITGCSSSNENDDAEDDESGENVYTAKGSSNGILFQLEFTIHQRTVTDVKTLEVSNLQIDSMAHVNEQHDAAFIHLEANNTCDGFAAVFPALTKLATERQNVFKNSHDKHAVVSLPETATGKRLFFSHPSLTGVTFEIEWDITMSHSLQINSSLQLRVNAPESVVVDVNSTANQFKQILTVMSPTEAIDAIIRLVYID